MTAAQGHPHHHWIVESENKRLLLSAKSSPVQGPGPLHAIPLRTYERMISRKSVSPIQSFPWENDFEVVVLPADEVTRRARLAVDFCSISRADRLLDPIVRNLRRIKYGRFHSTAHETRSWWEHMLTISRPYSKIPL